MDDLDAAAVTGRGRRTTATMPASEVSEQPSYRERIETGLGIVAAGRVCSCPRG